MDGNSNYGSNTLVATTAHRKKKGVGFRFFGGKQKLAPEIVELLPKRGRCFFDLFAGRGNFTLAAMEAGLEFDQWVLNDIRTANFFRALSSHGGTLVVPEKTPAEFARLKQLAMQGDPEAILLAPFFTYDGAGFEFAGLSTKGGCQTPQSYQDRVRRAQSLLSSRNVVITDLDWRECLDKFTVGVHDVVIADPPYMGVDMRAYRYDDICPEELIDVLRKATCNWILCEFRQPLLVADFGEPILTTPSGYGTDKRVTCVWTNIGKQNQIRDNVTNLTEVPENRDQSYYLTLPLPELIHELKEGVAVLGLLRRKAQAEYRRRLLPALRILKERTLYKRPGYYQILREIGLNPDTVRQWEYRSRTVDEILEVIEEPSTHTETTKRNKQHDKSKESKEESKDSEEETENTEQEDTEQKDSESRTDETGKTAPTVQSLLEHAKQMALAVLQGKYQEAARLAHGYMIAIGEPVPAEACVSLN